MFWKVILFLFAGTLGQISGAYTVIMPLCCLRMGIPFSNRIQSFTGVDMSKVKARYWVSVIFWLVIDAVLLAVLLLFIPKLYAIAFGIGTTISLAMGFGQTGLNGNNLSDFVSFACSSLNEDEQSRVMEYIETLI